jgi:ABC-type branched-subunit amino acid transport system substrate-binding protein
MEAPRAESLKPKAVARFSGTIATVKVALLLPLSGDSKELGQAMLDAATLALYDKYVMLPPEHITAQIVLIPKDTGSSPSNAATVAQQAIDQGAQLIIGPLYSSAVQAAAPIARKAGVPMIALSNNRVIAGNGVYAFGFIPEQQVVRVAEYAALQNISAVASLAPNDPYGQTVTETLTKTLRDRAVRVEPVETYARSATNLEAAATRLRQGYDANPFQALFIAEGGEQMGSIVTQLTARGLDKKNLHFIGTGLWDDPETMRIPLLKGAWYASGPTEFYGTFERRFVSTYGYTPKRVASLAYDAVSLAATLTLQKGGANFDAETLTNPQGFVGPSNGLYRLKKDGTAEHALAIMEITGGAPKILEAAPRKF